MQQQALAVASRWCCALWLSQALNRHHFAYEDRHGDNKMVLSPGFYQWRDGGEKHMNDPLTIANIQVSLFFST